MKYKQIKCSNTKKFLKIKRIYELRVLVDNKNIKQNKQRMKQNIMKVIVHKAKMKYYIASIDNTN